MDLWKYGLAFLTLKADISTSYPSSSILWSVIFNPESIRTCTSSSSRPNIVHTGQIYSPSPIKLKPCVLDTTKKFRYVIFNLNFMSLVIIPNPITVRELTFSFEISHYANDMFSRHSCKYNVTHKCTLKRLENYSS